MGFAQPADLATAFATDGYVVIPGMLSERIIDQIEREAGAFYERHGIEPSQADRTMNFHQESPALREVLEGAALRNVLRRLLRQEPWFLQSIYFNSGSQQAAHSDYIYMSTNPPMQLCGVWFALEDVSPTAGPLMYFPGSQQMPIQGIKDFWEHSRQDIRDSLVRDEERLLARYAERIERTGEDLATCVFYDGWLNRISTYVHGVGVPMRTFAARKGDVLVWHANLVHGGTTIQDPSQTRKSVVAHYLTDVVEEYYDMNYTHTLATIRLSDIDQERAAILIRK